MIRSPSAVHATPVGVDSEAASAGPPSPENPELPEPMVATLPAWSNTDTRCNADSATAMSPWDETDMPEAVTNCSL